MPLNKVMEQNAYRLADKRGMSDFTSIVFEKEQNTIRAEILGGKCIRCFFMVLHELEKFF